MSQLVFRNLPRFSCALCLIFSAIILLQLSTPSSAEICADYYRCLTRPYTNLSSLLHDPYTFVDRYLESNLSFNYFPLSPHPLNVQTDLVLIRHSGFIVAPLTGWYRFSFYADDGFEFFLNGSTTPLMQSPSIWGVGGIGSSGNTSIYLRENDTIPFDSYIRNERGDWFLYISWTISENPPENPGVIYVLDRRIPASAFLPCNVSESPTIIALLPSPRPDLVDAFYRAPAENPGFCGSYFDRNAFTSFPNGINGNPSAVLSAPSFLFSRPEPGIDYFSTRSAPFPGLPPSTRSPPGFSIVFQGYIIPPETATYTLFFSGGPDLRIFLNGQRILNQPFGINQQIDAEVSTPYLNMTADTPYFFEFISGESQITLANYTMYLNFVYYLDWTIYYPNGSAVRSRVPPSAMRTVFCPSSLSPLPLRTNLTANGAITDGQYTISGNATIIGNITLARASLIIPSNSNVSFSGTINLDNSSALILSAGSSISIYGNVTFALNSTLTIQSNGELQGTPAVLVSGGISIGGATVVIQVYNSTIEALRQGKNVSIFVIQFASSDGAPQEIQPSGDLASCERLVASPSYSPTNIIVLVTLDSSACRIEASFPTWAIVVIVVSVVVIALAAGVFIWIRKRKQKKDSTVQLRQIISRSSTTS